MTDSRLRQSEHFGRHSGTFSAGTRDLIHHGLREIPFDSMLPSPSENSKPPSQTSTASTASRASSNAVEVVTFPKDDAALLWQSEAAWWARGTLFESEIDEAVTSTLFRPEWRSIKPSLHQQYHKLTRIRGSDAILALHTHQPQLALFDTGMDLIDALNIEQVADSQRNEPGSAARSSFSSTAVPFIQYCLTHSHQQVFAITGTDNVVHVASIRRGVSLSWKRPLCLPLTSATNRVQAISAIDASTPSTSLPYNRDTLLAVASFQHVSIASISRREAQVLATFRIDIDSTIDAIWPFSDFQCLVCASTSGTIAIVPYTLSQQHRSGAGETSWETADSTPVVGSKSLSEVQADSIQKHTPRPFLLVGHSKRVTSLMRHPSSSPSFITASLDGYIRIWHLGVRDCTISLNLGTPLHQLAPLKQPSTFLVVSEQALRAFSISHALEPCADVGFEVNKLSLLSSDLGRFSVLAQDSPDGLSAANHCIVELDADGTIGRLSTMPGGTSCDTPQQEASSANESIRQRNILALAHVSRKSPADGKNSCGHLSPCLVNVSTEVGRLPGSSQLPAHSPSVATSIWTFNEEKTEEMHTKADSSAKSGNARKQQLSAEEDISVKVPVPGHAVPPSQKSTPVVAVDEPTSTAHPLQPLTRTIGLQTAMSVLQPFDTKQPRSASKAITAACVLSQLDTAAAEPLPWPLNQLILLALGCQDGTLSLVDAIGGEELAVAPDAHTDAVAHCSCLSPLQADISNASSSKKHDTTSATASLVSWSVDAGMRFWTVTVAAASDTASDRQVGTSQAQADGMKPTLVARLACIRSIITDGPVLYLAPAEQKVATVVLPDFSIDDLSRVPSQYFGRITRLLPSPSVATPMHDRSQPSAEINSTADASQLHQRLSILDLNSVEEYTHPPQHDHEGFVVDLCQSSSLKLLASADCDGVVKLWTLENRLLLSIETNSPVGALAFFGDEGELLLAIQSHVAILSCQEYLQSSYAAMNLGPDDIQRRFGSMSSMSSFETMRSFRTQVVPGAGRGGEGPIDPELASLKARIEQRDQEIQRHLTTRATSRLLAADDKPRVSDRPLRRRTLVVDGQMTMMRSQYLQQAAAEETPLLPDPNQWILHQPLQDQYVSHRSARSGTVPGYVPNSVVRKWLDNYESWNEQLSEKTSSDMFQPKLSEKQLDALRAARLRQEQIGAENAKEHNVDGDDVHKSNGHGSDLLQRVSWSGLDYDQDDSDAETPMPDRNDSTGRTGRRSSTRRMFRRQEGSYQRQGREKGKAVTKLCSSSELDDDAADRDSASRQSLEGMLESMHDALAIDPEGIRPALPRFLTQFRGTSWFEHHFPRATPKTFDFLRQGFADTSTTVVQTQRAQQVPQIRVEDVIDMLVKPTDPLLPGSRCLLERTGSSQRRLDIVKAVATLGRQQPRQSPIRLAVIDYLRNAVDRILNRASQGDDGSLVVDGVEDRAGIIGALQGISQQCLPQLETAFSHLGSSHLQRPSSGTATTDTVDLKATTELLAYSVCLSGWCIPVAVGALRDAGCSPEAATLMVRELDQRCSTAAGLTTLSLPAMISSARHQVEVFLRECIDFCRSSSSDAAALTPGQGVVVPAVQHWFSQATQGDVSPDNARTNESFKSARKPSTRSRRQATTDSHSKLPPVGLHPPKASDFSSLFRRLRVLPTELEVSGPENSHMSPATSTANRPVTTPSLYRAAGSTPVDGPVRTRRQVRSATSRRTTAAQPSSPSGSGTLPLSSRTGYRRPSRRMSTSEKLKQTTSTSSGRRQPSASIGVRTGIRGRFFSAQDATLFPME